MPGLFDSDLEKFDARAPDASGNRPPGLWSVAVGFIGGTLLSWIVLLLLTSVGFAWLGIRWMPGRWLLPLALVGGAGVAALLHHFDRSGSSKYLVPICYLISLFCLIIILLYFWHPEFFRLSFGG